MPLVTRLTSEIEAGPSGSHIGAFFDFDRTLISGFSATAFMRDWIVSGRASAADIADTALAAVEFQMGRTGFSGFLTRSLGMVRGLEESEFEKIAEGISNRSLQTEVYPEARAIVQAHARKGHTVAIVSSAMRYQIEAIARELGIEHILCTQIEVRDGRFTGEIVRPPCYGEGKAVAARGFSAKHDIDLVESYFYTDSDEDLPLLDIVGHPRPVNPNRALAAISAKRGWATSNFGNRGLPSTVEFLRTSLALGSVVPSFLVGMPALALDGNLRDAINLTASTWGELGSALAGIHVRTAGEQNLWCQRPAVFVFNHQSAIDALLVCKLLRRDFVGIGKKELRSYPVFGSAFALAGTIFIDRLNSAKAVQALEPAVAALSQGISIAIAPEGTRSLTPRPGKFKKGAFRLAIAGKVPIIPIVFHNALDALPKHSVVVRPTTVDVTVLDPISTEDWDPGDLDTHIEHVRQRFIETLEA